jgi:hypothetical protein
VRLNAAQQLDELDVHAFFRQARETRISSTFTSAGCLTA